jgi:hypothetical protein
METSKLNSGFLTSNGNVLNVNLSCFQNLKGEFLRLVGNTELEYLEGVLTPVIFPNGIPQPKEIPYWNFLWETRFVDESNYFWARSNNGGCYSNTTRSMYFHRNLNGKNEYCRLDYNSSSSEFSQTSDGSYQNDIATIILIGANIELKYDVWSMSGSEDYTEEALERYATMVDLKEVLNSTNGGETSNYNSDGCYNGGSSEVYYDELSRMEKLERFKELKSVGVDVLGELYPNRNKKIYERKRKRIVK